MQGNHKRLHTAFLMNPKDDAALQETVFQYLERIDPIRLKYAVEPDHIINDTKLYRSPMPTSVRREATLYESTFRYGDLNKETYSSIRKNLMLVYGSESVVQKDIHLFHLTEKKIIRDYLAIPQLEKMFDEDYFNFEWDMHVGVNFTEHRNDYQRDHFVHEIRDMYSMLILLDEYGFFDASFDILRDKTASKISRFAYRKFNNFLMNKSGNYSLLERIRPDLMRSLTSDDNISNEAKKRCSTIEDYAAKILKEYLDLKGIKQQSLFDKDAKSQFVRDVFRIKPIKPSSRVFYTLLENGVLQFYLELLREADATREELQDFIREILEFIKDFQDHRKELHDYKKEFQDLIKKFQDYGMGKLYKEIWVRFYNAIEKHTKDFVEKSGIGSAASEYYRNIMCVLVYETLEQYAKEVGDTISYSIFSSDFYYCQYAPKKDDDMFYQCVEAYCNAENDFNSYRHFDNNMVNPYINYFADLAFFEAMNQDIQSKNLEDFKKPI